MAKKGKKSGELSDEDTLLWQGVLKTVTPYGKPSASPAEDKTPAKPKSGKTARDKTPHASARAVSFPPPPQKAPPQKPSSGFDASTQARLKKGALPIEGRIDLHGMTQDRAHAALMSFVRRALKDGKRTLLVITGKGDAQKNTGVLRRLLPLWLEESEFSRDVLALAQAQPKDGGGGAFYLRLRKKRG